MRFMSDVPCTWTARMRETNKEKTKQLKLTSGFLPSPTCCSAQCQVWSIGIISSFLSFIMMMMSMVMLVTENTWYLVMQKAQLWLEENKWDIKVSSTPKKCEYSKYLYKIR